MVVVFLLEHTVVAMKNSKIYKLFYIMFRVGENIKNFRTKMSELKCKTKGLIYLQRRKKWKKQKKKDHKQQVRVEKDCPQGKVKTDN